jgi:hypothetical protein
MNARSVFLGACLGSLCCSLTACGGTDQAAPAVTAKSDPVAAVRAAADTTTKAGSSHTRSTLTMNVGGKTVALRGTGAFDYAKGVGTLTLDVPPHAGLTGQLAEIVTPQALYLKNALPNVPKDKWVRLDTAKVQAGLLAGGGNDPSTSFEMLRGAKPGVELIGDDLVAGVKVRHYRGVLDVKAAGDLATSGVRTALEATTKTLADTSVPFDAYLDDAGRLRQVVETFTLAAGAGGGARTTKVVSSAELYDFGTPVVVKTPPAAQTVVGNLTGR